MFKKLDQPRKTKKELTEKTKPREKMI